MLGYELSRKGIPVLVLEKEELPRSKVCAGGIPKRLLNLVDFDLSPVIEERINCLEFTYCLKNKFLLYQDSPFIYTVKRDKFDYFLIQKAEEAGSEVKDGQEVVDIRITDKGVTIATPAERFEGEILVGADGWQSRVAKLANFSIRRGMVTTIEGEVEAPDFLEENRGKVRVDFGTIPFGYSWILPKKDLLSIGIGGFHARIKEPKKYFDYWLKNSVPHYLRLDFFFCPISLGGLPQQIAKNRVCLIGEAGNFVFPLTGEGIYFSVLSAKLASSAIVEAFETGNYGLQNYQKLVEKEIYPLFKRWRILSYLFYSLPRYGYKFLIRNNKKIIRYFLDS